MLTYIAFSFQSSFLPGPLPAATGTRGRPGESLGGSTRSAIAGSDTRTGKKKLDMLSVRLPRLRTLSGKRRLQVCFILPRRGKGPELI